MCACLHVCAERRRAESLPVIYSMCTSAGGKGIGLVMGQGNGQMSMGQMMETHTIRQTQKQTHKTGKEQKNAHHAGLTC